MTQDRAGDRPQQETAEADGEAITGAVLCASDDVSWLLLENIMVTDRGNSGCKRCLSVHLNTGGGVASVQGGKTTRSD